MGISFWNNWGNLEEEFILLCLEVNVREGCSTFVLGFFGFGVVLAIDTAW